MERAIWVHFFVRRCLDPPYTQLLCSIPTIYPRCGQESGGGSIQHPKPKVATPVGQSDHTPGSVGQPGAFDQEGRLLAAYNHVAGGLERCAVRDAIFSVFIFYCPPTVPNLINGLSPINLLGF